MVRIDGRLANGLAFKAANGFPSGTVSGVRGPDESGSCTRGVDGLIEVKGFKRRSSACFTEVGG